MLCLLRWRSGGQGPVLAIVHCREPKTWQQTVQLYYEDDPLFPSKGILFINISVPNKIPVACLDILYIGRVLEAVFPETSARFFFARYYTRSCCQSWVMGHIGNGLFLLAVYTVPKEIDFPRYNMKFSRGNVILGRIFHLVSCFPLHLMLYRGNVDWFSNSVLHSM